MRKLLILLLALLAPLAYGQNAATFLLVNSRPAITVVASSSLGAAISPSGYVHVKKGANKSFAISTDLGSIYDSLYVDGVKSDSTTSYTFRNVRTRHTITAYAHSPAPNFVSRYISPAGSSGNTGLTRLSPWDFYTGRTWANDSAGYGGTLYLMDGVYSLSNSTKETLGRGNGYRTRWVADSAARPILTKSNGYPPNFTFNTTTTFKGIWFGGNTESAANSSRSVTAGDSIIECVFWGTYDDGIGGSQYPVVIRNSLFSNVGHRIYNGSTHGIYLTGQPPSADQGLHIERNVFVYDGDSTGGYSGAYATHTYHGPTYVTNFKNVVFRWGSAYPADGANNTIRDNVFWATMVNGRWNPEPANETDREFNSVYASATNLIVAHNFHGKIGYGGNWGASFSGVDSNWWTNSAVQGGVPAYNGGGYDYGQRNNTGHVYNYRTDVTGLLGRDSTFIDTLGVALAQSFKHKSAATVYADTSIVRRWRQMVALADTWQGTVEDSIGVLPSAGPTYTTVYDTLGANNEGAVWAMTGNNPGTSPVENITYGGGLYGGVTGSNERDFGLIFQLAIPQGKTIDSVFIRLYETSGEGTTDSMKIMCYNVDNASVFTNHTHYPREHESAVTDSIVWSGKTNTGGVWKETPNLASIVQTVISRAGWASGNNLGIIVTADGTPVGRDIWYDYEQGSNYPNIRVVYH